MVDDICSRRQRSFPLLPANGSLRNAIVIGAGIAGLCTTRQLLRIGVQVLVLEANSSVGGIWARNYDGYGLQIPWAHYQFPEFLWPKELQPKAEYASGQEVHAYINAYVERFGLMPHIRLNCKLLRLRWCAEQLQWEALFCDTAKQKFFKAKADYAVICSGLYSNPYIPHYKGAETFAGLQLHAKDFTSMAMARGRRVVIVGAGKTALDCMGGLLASRVAASVTLLYRRAHWPVPRSAVGMPVQQLLFGRAAAAMLPPYYAAGRVDRAVHAVTSSLKRLFWRGMECAIARKFKLGSGKLAVPGVGLPGDLFYGGQILEDSSGELLQCETLTTIKGEINQFVARGVILQDGSFQPADVILYCTGYVKTYDYLEGEMREQLGLQKDGLYLYRNCLPCAVPHLAYIGSEVSTHSNIVTDSLQAMWLAHVLTGAVQLPPPDAMAADVREQQRWRREVMPAQRNRGAVLMMYGMQYHDQLLRDMGQTPRRKGLNLLAECFGAYSPEDYQPLVERIQLPAAASWVESSFAGGCDSSSRTLLGHRADAAGGPGTPNAGRGAGPAAASAGCSGAGGAGAGSLNSSGNSYGPAQISPRLQLQNISQQQRRRPQQHVQEMRSQQAQQRQLSQVSGVTSLMTALSGGCRRADGGLHTLYGSRLDVCIPDSKSSGSSGSSGSSCRVSSRVVCRLPASTLTSSLVSGLASASAAASGSALCRVSDSVALSTAANSGGVPSGFAPVAVAAAAASTLGCGSARQLLGGSACGSAFRRASDERQRQQPVQEQQQVQQQQLVQQQQHDLLQWRGSPAAADSGEVTEGETRPAAATAAALALEAEAEAEALEADVGFAAISRTDADLSGDAKGRSDGVAPSTGPAVAAAAAVTPANPSAPLDSPPLQLASVPGAGCGGGVSAARDRGTRGRCRSGAGVGAPTADTDASADVGVEPSPRASLSAWCLHPRPQAPVSEVCSSGERGKVSDLTAMLAQDFAIGGTATRGSGVVPFTADDGGSGDGGGGGSSSPCLRMGTSPTIGGARGDPAPAWPAVH
ncbi:hypothetical protein PLESTM_000523600 [Pleodorina starrii]|nr:hypothetical protein PLESTM_000523600 [Pleodorina starrii]